MDALVSFVMPSGTWVPWNRIITEYAKTGRISKALQSFRKMLRAGIQPDKFTFISVLKACANTATLEEGKFIHACLVNKGFESELILVNSLINMYGKCGSVEDALKMFRNMSNQDVASWTTMISTYAQHGYRKEALLLFQGMCQAGVKPNKITFITILNTCDNSSVLQDIHVLITNHGMDSNVVVGNCLISLYSKCGSLDDAQKVFDRVTTWNVVSWNAMITAYIQHGRAKEAFQIFAKLQRQEGIPADNATFVSVLKGCVGPVDLEMGKKIHAETIKSAIESDVVVGTALVNMYGKCGTLEDTGTTFAKIVKRNVITWTAMISVYIMHGLDKKALQSFQEMQQEGMKPDRITFVEILEACGSSAALEDGKVIHSNITDMGFETDEVVGTALIGLYGKCGRMEDAKTVFSKMTKRNIITWTAMISVYAQLDCGKEALKHFQQMQEEGLKPNKVTFLGILDACATPTVIAEGKWVHALITEHEMELDTVIGNALVNMYSKCGSLKDAHVVFSRMPQGDVISWTAIFSAYAQHGQGEQAFKVFQQMQHQGMKPDKVTFISILDVCGKFRALELGKLIHSYIIDSGFESDASVGNALVSMYNKCGNIEAAHWVFNKVSQRGLILWSAIIAAYAQHGLGMEAVQLFRQMKHEQVKPDEITFVSVLCACSHAGLVDESLAYFDSMSQVDGIIPNLEHYMCILDLLGRAGLLDKAEAFIDRMPFQPSAVMWMTVLGACRIHNDIEHGKRAAEYILELDSSNTAAYVLLSNIYATAGKWHGVEKVRDANNG